MAHEEEIKSAQKLVDKWIKQSQQSEIFFNGLKKENLKWEKDEIKQIEQLMNSKNAPSVLGRIEDCRRAIQDQYDEGLAHFKRHEKFVLGAPREGSVGICNELKLKPKTPAYDAVNKAMGKALMECTKQFAKTGDLWTNDLLPKIKIFQNKLASLEKMATTFKSHNLVYLKQLKKDVEQFESDLESRISELKVNMADMAIKKLAGNPDEWLAGDPKMRRDQFNVFSGRVVGIDQLIAISEKNRGRILKSVPEEFKTQPALLEVISAMEKEWKKNLLTIKEAQGKFKIAIAYCKKAYPAEFS